MDLNEINKRMYKSISDDDIEKYMNTKKHVYRYGELNQLFNGIDDILPKPNDYAILLIESKKNVGHWVALTRTDNIINWFDSYGIKPGNELKWVSEKENQELDNTKSDITDLLDDAINKGYKVKYNTRRYQSSDAEIATCGRHSILFVLMSKYFNYDVDKYYQFMERIKKAFGLNADQIVSMVIK